MSRDEFTSIYFNEPLEFTASEQCYYERAIGCEISEVSSVCMNLYTTDDEIIKAFIDLIGDFYISEISKGGAE